MRRTVVWAFLGFFLIAILSYASPVQMSRNTILNLTNSSNYISYNESTFNNSRTTENFTWDYGLTSANRTSYVTVPKNAVVLNATIKFAVSLNYSYREIVNLKGQMDWSNTGNSADIIGAWNNKSGSVVDNIYILYQRSSTNASIFQYNINGSFISNTTPNIASDLCSGNKITGFVGNGTHFIISNMDGGLTRCRNFFYGNGTGIAAVNAGSGVTEFWAVTNYSFRNISYYAAHKSTEMGITQGIHIIDPYTVGHGVVQNNIAPTGSSGIMAPHTNTSIQIIFLGNSETFSKYNVSTGATDGTKIAEFKIHPDLKMSNSSSTFLRSFTTNTTDGSDPEWFWFITDNQTGTWHPALEQAEKHIVRDAVGSIGGGILFDLTGKNLVSNQTFTNATSLFNSALSSCTADSNGNCDISIVVNSSNIGTLKVTLENITYHYNSSLIYSNVSPSIQSIFTNDHPFNVTYELRGNGTVSPNDMRIDGFYLHDANSTTVCGINSTAGTISGQECRASLNVSAGNLYNNTTYWSTVIPFLEMNLPTACPTGYNPLGTYCKRSSLSGGVTTYNLIAFYNLSTGSFQGSSFRISFPMDRMDNWMQRASTQIAVNTSSGISETDDAVLQYANITINPPNVKGIYRMSINYTYAGASGGSSSSEGGGGGSTIVVQITNETSVELPRIDPTGAFLTPIDRFQGTLLQGLTPAYLLFAIAIVYIVYSDYKFKTTGRRKVL